jgi:hypothetical protein
MTHGWQKSPHAVLESLSLLDKRERTSEDARLGIGAVSNCTNTEQGCQLMTTGVSVEKLILARLAENSSRQDALQAIFSGWVDIFYHRIRGRFRRKRVFQQPRDLPTTECGQTHQMLAREAGFRPYGLLRYSP